MLERSAKGKVTDDPAGIDPGAAGSLTHRKSVLRETMGCCHLRRLCMEAVHEGAVIPNGKATNRELEQRMVGTSRSARHTKAAAKGWELNDDVACSINAYMLEKSLGVPEFDNGFG